MNPIDDAAEYMEIDREHSATPEIQTQPNIHTPPDGKFFVTVHHMSLISK